MGIKDARVGEVERGKRDVEVRSVTPHVVTPLPNLAEQSSSPVVPFSDLTDPQPTVIHLTDARSALMFITDASSALGRSLLRSLLVKSLSIPSLRLVLPSSDLLAHFP